MKHNWSTICQRSIIDQDTNQISLIDCVEQLNLPKEAFSKNLPFRIEIISYFTEANVTSAKRVKRIIKLIDPQGNELDVFKDKEMEIPKQFSRFRLRYLIHSIPTTIPGTYKFKIFIQEDNKELIEVSELDVDMLLKK